MKKIIAALTVAVMVMSLVACGNKEPFFIFDVPQGFEKVKLIGENGAETYMPQDSKSLGSYMSYAVASGDGSFDGTTPELLMEETKKIFKEQYGVAVRMELTNNKSYEVEGFPAVRYDFEYTYQGFPVKQFTVMVDTGKQCHILCYTEINNEGYMDAYEKSAESIRFD